MMWSALNENEKDLKSDYDIQCAVTKAENECSIVWRLFKAVYTFIAFFVACCLVPWLFFLFIGVRICRHLFVRWLQKKFKGLEFVKKTTVRTAVDTQRNQGIITVLLTVAGPCQLNLIKNRIQADIVEREKAGRIVFPHLRTVLTSRWGNYAWVKGSEKQFRIDNHIVTASGTFKGRSVSDANIQEYVSDIIAKLLPPEFPPWQITVIPTQQDRTTYLLIRLHHLYLSEDGLSLGELLLLRSNDSSLPNEPDLWGNSSLLSGVFRTPVFIPQVYENLCESFSNWWNEILYKYDPADNPSILKEPGLKLFFILCAMTTVSTFKEYFRTENASFWEAAALEKERKGLSAELFWRSLYRSIAPLNVIRSCVRLWSRMVLSIVKLPLMVSKLALDTPVYLYWLYMAHYVVQESLYLFRIFYSAPRVIFEEIFLPEHPRNVHQLQTLSFCGRKVVNWSAPVPVEIVKKLRQVTGSTTSEVAMSAVASSLRDYFESAGYAVPDAVMTTCFFTAQEDLFARRGNLTSGMLCLPLPTQTPKNDPMESLKALRTSLFKARSTQAPLYLASVYQMDYRLFTTVFPTLFAKACLYLLSRRYTVSVTQVDSTRKDENVRMQLLWGQRVERVMYWRPPQANVGLSLTLINYGDSVQLGAMADAQLAPHFSKIVTSFPTNVYKLARTLGLKSIPSARSSEPVQQ
ncbi:transcription initiation factor tfiid subunit [Nesidiocoris tenuis]|uniref:Transcription initiation factor tfiid subunit n=1 Tax=Nesidiocoris tenuis TaxID=355587 RepID=A0ABN7B3W2_9HEMI|nr:transcription initiation factor tfiid subunit [Nesidiocoris tenuis]